MSVLTDKITGILKEDIHYSPQVQGFVVHGAIEKIEDLFKKEMEKILEWGCRQGYDPEPGILHKIEIMGKAYTIQEALNIYLESVK